MKKLFVTLAILLTVLCQMSTISHATCTEGTRKEREERIAKVCIKYWDKYGVLPSVCLAQAWEESTLGKNCPNYNLWGKTHWSYVDNLEAGVLQYLRCINNGYYKNAPFKRNFNEQLGIILDSGYCYGQSSGGSYHRACQSLYRRFNLGRFDHLVGKKNTNRVSKYSKKELKKLREKAMREARERARKLEEEKRQRELEFERNKNRSIAELSNPKDIVNHDDTGEVTEFANILPPDTNLTERLAQNKEVIKATIKTIQ